MNYFLIGFIFSLTGLLTYDKPVNTIINDRHLQNVVLNFLSIQGINKLTKFPNGIMISNNNPEITIFNKYDNKYIKLIKNRINQKEIVICNENYIVVRYRIDFIKYYDYLLKRGDSAVVTYQNNIPLVTVPNRISLKYDFNFDNYFRNRFINNKYSVLDKYFNPSFFSSWMQSSTTKLAPEQLLKNLSKLTPEQRMTNLLENTIKDKKKLYRDVMTLIRSEDTLLDSLKEHKLISKEPYQFYKNRINNFNYILSIENNELSIIETKRVLHEYRADLYVYPETYHHQLIEAIADKYITDKSKFLDIQDGVNRDYRQVYIQIKNSLIFTEDDKNYLLNREINRIGQTFSRKDFLTFFKKYEQDVKDTMLVNSIRANYKLDFDESRTTTGSIVLADFKGAKLTFDDVLKRHKGKIIYVDFWASWCGPCREALPSSIKLRAELKGKDVVFVYLSIDKTLKPWQAASAQEKLDTHQENYLVVNYQTSDFMKQQKLTSIPRYMIFDKQGKLAYANAPRVESKNLSALLTGLAK